MLADGSKVPKTAARIEAYGTVDELNSFVGLLKDKLICQPQAPLQAIAEQLTRIQNELFDVGGELATPAPVLDINKQQVVTKDTVAQLESEMDQWNSSLAPLENFVLPGGHECNSLAHVCRTICRRAERQLAQISATEAIRSEPQVYLNRLSDWFFLAARTISQHLQCPEIQWQQSGKSL